MIIVFHIRHILTVVLSRVVKNKMVKFPITSPRDKDENKCILQRRYIIISVIVHCEKFVKNLQFNIGRFLFLFLYARAEAKQPLIIPFLSF